LFIYLKINTYRIKNRVERILDYPGCDSSTLMLRKLVWTMSLFSFIPICGLTFCSLLFFPQLTLLIGYSTILMIYFLVYLVGIPFLKGPGMWLLFAIQLLIIITTFLFILLLGGIAHSGGLIFVGLSAILFSIPFQNRSYSISIFLLFSLTVIASGILKPRLNVPAQMNPEINSTLYVVNTLWLSASLLWFCMSFVLQKDRIDKLNAQKLKELGEAKTKLFANITHEFRTPLTIILGMAELINSHPENWVENGTRKIKTNAKLLLRLVNQMLDMARLDTGGMPVSLVQGDIISFLSYQVGLFQSRASSRNINLKFVPGVKNFEMDFDCDILMHIVSNLVTVALKFTPNGGGIVVSATTNGNGRFLVISIKDSGIGMSSQDLMHIFDRFYPHENWTKKGGVGLGLTLTKELVDLIGGEISVTSSHGQGTEFSVRLPIHHNAMVLSESKLMELNQKEIDFHDVDPQRLSPTHELENNSNNLPVILIIEDNDDVVQFLNAILRADYHVFVAENGRSGLSKALELVPDIILSDIMMPEMDGIELLSILKNDFRTSHIPVVLLTAKADMESRLEGLNKGADAYLAKPFEKKELQAQLKNLIEFRNRLHLRYAKSEFWPINSDPIFKIEDDFMYRVRMVLEANLDDDDFGIAQLCKELGVSHSQLYRKFKSLSNRTIAEYFKVLRLERAKTLLQSSQLNISQIAFAVGFKNLSHFSREFTRSYDKSPSEYRKGGK
jgi:signal transduction histidine kinase/AraC-like DNA-binding protein